MALVPSQLLLEGRAFQRYGTYSDISGYGSHFASVMFACVRAFSLMARIPQSPNPPIPQLKGCSRVGSLGITGSLPRYNPMVIYQSPLPLPQPYMQDLRLPKPACSGAGNQVVFLACKQVLNASLLHSASWLCWDHSECPNPWRTPGRSSQF